jgi:lysophospholipase L1-like esterase
MGGSITEMQGYRPMVVQTLRTRFPATKFEFVNAGISSTCSHTGAFRVRRDVLAHQPDLLLVEFAVNDNQDAAHSYNQAVRGMEGIVRTVRRESPQTDIVMLHFVNPEILQAVQRGETPASIAAHEAVAAHYGVPSCNVALELAERIAAGTISWEQYGGVHPGRPGNRLAADLVEQVFDANGFSMGAERPDGVKDKAGTATSEPPPTSSRQDLPPALDPASYVRGRFLDPETVDFGPGWQLRQPDWSKLPGRSRERFAERQLAVSRQPGAELSVRFQGTALGLYVLAGPDAGAVEVSVNDGPWRRWELYHRFSRGLHYPRTVVVASGLKPGQHHVRVRHSRSKHPDSQGSAVRVLEFAVSAAERN